MRWCIFAIKLQDLIYLHVTDILHKSDLPSQPRNNIGLLSPFQDGDHVYAHVFKVVVDSIET